MDPVFFKELRGATSKQRLWILRLISAVVLATILGVGYHLLIQDVPSIRFEAGQYGADISQKLSKLGQTIFTYFSIGQLALIMLMVPIFSGATITGEKEVKTLDLLLCSPLSPFRIVMGKMKLCLISSFALIIAGAPLMFVVSFFGGVGLEQMIGVNIICLATAMLASAISIYASCLFESTTKAIFSGIMVLISVEILLTFLSFMMLEFAALGASAALMNLFKAGGTEFSYSWAVAPVCMAILSLFFLRLAAGTLTNRPIIEIVHHLEGRRVVLEKRAGQKKAFGASIPNMLCNFDTVFTNPIYRRDAKMGFWTGVGFFTKSAFGLMILLGFMAIVNLQETDYQMGDMIKMLFVLPVLLMMLFGAFCSPPVVGKEYELQTMDSLFTTPLTVNEIMQGKFLGFLRNMIILWAFYIPVVILFMLTGMIHFLAGLLIILGAFVYPMFAGLLGLFLGVICKNSLRSTAYAVLLLFICGFGGFLLKNVFFGAPEFKDTFWGYSSAIFSPIYGLFLAIDGGAQFNMNQLYFIPIVTLFAIIGVVMFRLLPKYAPTS